ncbi:MAG: hypothetical protein Q7S03_03530 [bacterium]|nr:hypothetical protein [bacterium]
MIVLSINKKWKKDLSYFLEKRGFVILLLCLVIISVFSWINFYINGLSLAYNDARSHLDIGRRVVEGLKPGLAQLGSVWLPLPHALMLPTVWNDFMWHSGLSGTIPSMVSFVATGLLVYSFLKLIGVGFLGRVVGVFVFVANINILYLQSTAMTELLLLATMTAGAYELVLWHKTSKIINLIQAGFWIMLSTLVRYEGWFLFVMALVLICYHVYRKRGLRATEGVAIFFSTLAALGIALWLGWNFLIFKDPLYFVFGPFSARAQQQVLAKAGELFTQGNLYLSVKFYFYALAYSSGTFTLILGAIGLVLFLLERKINETVRVASLALLAPLFFNVLALYLGHSVLHIQGLSGDTWFNVRYGVMMAPSLAIFIGFLVHKLKRLRGVLVGFLLFITFFTFSGSDAVTIDDARFGASQKNVTEVSSWLEDNAANKPGFILISAASHDAIIFSSGLPMKRFIHEGTGDYWKEATEHPSSLARWIIMRTNDMSDLTFKAVSSTDELSKYRLVGNYPFADIYELKDEYMVGG